MTVWVLTAEHNDYDQHGEYFINVFYKKPDVIQISAILGEEVSFEYCQHIVDKGGRTDKMENVWYNLTEVTPL